MIEFLAATSNGPGDPLYLRGIGTFAHPSLIFITLLKAAVVFAVVIGSTIVMSALHRKFRRGEEIAGATAGAAMASTDGTTHGPLLRVAPYAALVSAVLAYAVVPFGDVIHVFGHDTRVQLADPGAGILVLLAFWAISIVLLLLSSWAANSYDTTQRAVEAVVTALAALVVIAFAVAAAVGVAADLHTSSIVASQQGPLRHGWPHWLHSWNIITTGVVPFLLYLAAGSVLLRVNPAAERVSGLRQSALFFAARLNEVVLIAFAVVLFLGGGDGPTADFLPDAYWSVLWFAVKSLVLAALLLRLWSPRLGLVNRTAGTLVRFGVPVAAGWTLASLAWRVRDSYALYVGAAALLLLMFFSLAGYTARERREDAELNNVEPSIDEASV